MLSSKYPGNSRYALALSTALLALGALTAAGALRAAAPSPATAPVTPTVQPVERPNIVLFLADDLGWNALRCTGNTAVDTPNLDRLAREGMRFTRAYAEPQCSPTRAALLSGQWCARTNMHRVTHEKQPDHAPLIAAEAATVLPPETANLAASLRKAGYATGLSGKWHIADNYNAAPLRNRPGYFDRYGFDYCGAAENGVGLPQGEQDKSVNGITDDMIGFIEKNRERPFFAYFAHHAPHTPMQAPKVLIEKYVQKGYKRSSSPVCRTGERPSADYLAMVEHLDSSIGRVLKRLEELKLDQKTVVLFVSDNGGLGRMADMSPLRESKGSPYEGGIRVPVIVRWPGKIAAGVTNDTLTHTVDFYPTFLALAGASAPTGHPLDGLSLLPTLTGRGVIARQTLYWHIPTYTPMYGRTPCSSVRDGDWKLVHYYGDFLDTTGSESINGQLYGKLIVGERTELYNLKDDPAEKRDVAKENPTRVKELRTKLDGWLTETGAKLPRPNPSFDAKNPDWWKEGKASGD